MLLKDLYEKIDKRTKIRVSLLIGLLYSIYNLAVGFFAGTVWHTAIGIYYLLLLVVKFILQMVKSNDKMSTKLFITTSMLLFLISSSLVAPIIMMLRNQRPVSIPLEIAIGIAAYTTYKVTVAIINFVKRGLSNNLLVAELAAIGLIEAIVSVITLQNTLITVNGGVGDNGLVILSAVSSVVGLIGILYLIIRLIIKYTNNCINKINDEPSNY